MKGLGTRGRETREELLLWSIEQMTVGPVSWAWCRVASLVLIWGNKLSPNIMAESNEYKLSQLLWIRHLGVVEWNSSDSGSLMRLQSNVSQGCSHIKA